jgi:metal-sulfur cluster biosynthetic enzyme
VEDASVEIVWDEAWSPERLADSAREKLRFLPSPATVADPASYVAENWPEVYNPGGAPDDR